MVAYGPDNSLNLNDNQVAWVKVPRGRRAEFTFSSDAAWENAICLYPQNSDQKIIEKGNNNGRNLTSFATPENNTNSDQWYRVTGWHKQTPGSGRFPWIQSPFMTLINDNNETHLKYGFEDAGDGDYNDIATDIHVVD
jgi:hypothetical protein